MGRQGVFSPYPILPSGAFGPFSIGRVPQGVGPGRGMLAPPDGMGRHDVANAVITVVVGVEVAVHLPSLSL
jgi:hypothetical protein